MRECSSRLSERVRIQTSLWTLAMASRRPSREETAPEEHRLGGDGAGGLATQPVGSLDAGEAVDHVPPTPCTKEGGAND